MENKIAIKAAENEADFHAAKELILEYIKWLDFDLSFQNFDKEINSLSATYGYPDGRLFLAYRNDKAVGVAGIKRLNDTECELKRMFVQAESRGFKIGKLLLLACIETAKELNYSMIKLDTVDSMKSAIKLYTENGFVEISAYCHNPHEQARYFELGLNA